MTKNNTKMQIAIEEALKTDKWTETIMRAISSKVAKRWRFISFRSKKGREWRGVVDVIAIRKDTRVPKQKLLKRGDIFEILLIQMKGGTAKFPTLEDIRRLKEVVKYHKANGIVLFEWKKSKRCQFYILTKKMGWKPVRPAELFGT